MNLLVIIPAQLLLLLPRPGPQRHLHVARGVFAADHEANLPRGVGRDGGISVFDDGKDFEAGLFKVGDEGEVEPLIFGCWREGENQSG